eukprot:gene4694-4946_t
MEDPMQDAEARCAGEASTSAAACSSASADADSKPIVVLVIGMAGSGKTTLIQRLNSHMHQHKLVNYKNVMKQYGLGPNGGILTSCNLFATRFDQVGLSGAHWAPESRKPRDLVVI